MVYVEKRSSETVGSLLRRFTRRVQLSGILLESRRNRFHKSDPTRRAMRESALRRRARTIERARAEKLGVARSSASSVRPRRD
ncbi:MAG: hypothetical protein AAB539_03490 [Patescibacteria group bacterium]